MDQLIVSSRCRMPRLALLLLLVSISASGFFVLAHGLEMEKGGENTSTDTIRSLDRRTKMFLHSFRKDVTSEEGVISLEETGLGLLDAFFASLSMIIVSEIGDETFIIAALMAMRHPKTIVLSGALTALIVMTVLSTGLGRIVPNLISRKHTNSAATDSKASQKKEMEEVEEKLEGGQGKTTFRRFFSRFCTPIFLESFILTFLAEWGDRSQIATIALATHKNAIGVAVGATIGHALCTSLAVVGGSMLASKISQGTVATIGGFLFLGFSLSSYFYPPL
ncbi:GDT1-like protein 4 isoform X2 [Elaeis guineensis]|uniref:GDT1 family protein n=1 Tax=Elaeis guineensis var. tenera TaxID=51953 RepID=A0A6I9QGP0_ELAGV|nr:GDT1-like protein 4 isoform X2 [Elaeis guineensis]